MRTDALFDTYAPETFIVPPHRIAQEDVYTSLQYALQAKFHLVSEVRKWYPW